MKETAKLAPLAQETFSTDGSNQHLALDKYELWSPESPKLYKLVTTVSVDGKIVDRQETAFGIRTVAFDANEGFLLNGKHYEICGTCNHQDHAGVGAALPDALQYFRVAKLKEFSNAYRTAHNPPTPELLDACDRLGLLVMDESRTLGSDEANLRRWETQVRRDRNHPSVFLWSLCNEEAMQTDPNGGRVGATMQALAKKLDPTRAVTAAENVGDIFTGLQGTLEVRGWNYNINPERAVQVESYHAKHPDQPNLGSEQGSNRGTRGIYTDRSEARLRQCPVGRTSKDGGRSLPTAPGSAARSTGRASTTAANRRRISAGPASARTSEFWTPAAFPRTTSTISNPGGRTNRCCTWSRTGTGRGRKARRSKWMRSATRRKSSCFSMAKASGANRCREITTPSGRSNTRREP